MKVSCPRVVVAGTNSGVGKTSVTLALVKALRNRGLKVQTFKVGPDYLDPTYLEIASGSPCYNLDGWMAGRDYVCRLFAEKASGADISVIEGVMGLFDGSDPVDPAGSTAEVAAWLQSPVILVVNVHGMARSVAALVRGYSGFEPGVHVAGVVANHCGSERHGYWLGRCLEAFGLPELVATLPRGVFPELPSRHLGLVTANQRSLSNEVLDRLGAALDTYGSVENVISMARGAPDQELEVPLPINTPDNRVRLGIAYDEAFHFYYRDNLEALEAHGCDLIRFSPLVEEALPEALDGLYLGGGYPEVHAPELSENHSMLESVRRFAASGKPVYAECGGLMYLSRGIETLDGRYFPMAAVVPARTRMLDRLKSLGYVEVTLREDSLFGPRGATLRGHEFHYSELVGDPTTAGMWSRAYSVKRMRSDAIAQEGFQHGLVLASYVHGHLASRPEAVVHFVSLCHNARELT